MNFADKAVLNILAKSSQAFLLLFSSIIMVRAFSKSDYGTFLQVVLIANTITMFTFLGLPQSIFYFFQKTRNQRKFAIRNVALSLCISSIAAIIAYALKEQLAGWLNNHFIYVRVY